MSTDWDNPRIYDDPAPTPAPYEHMGEIEEAVFDAVEEHHLQNVVGYLASLAEQASPDNIGLAGPARSGGDKVEPYRRAAALLRQAQAALAAADFHTFSRVHGAGVEDEPE